MKVGIILSGNIELQPYVSYYTEVFDTLNIEYEYICWDRDNKSPLIYNNHKVISIDIKGSIKNNNFRKLYDYWLFSKIVINHLKKSHYDYLIVHTITNAVFLKNYLIKYYKNKYIFDIRDYSPIYPFVKGIVKKLIAQSVFTSISSDGFLKWLPKESHFIISHNVAKSFLEYSFCENIILSKDLLKILTIGKIRDFSSNKRVLEDLGNQNNIKMIFAGSGTEKGNLELFALNRYTNVVFTGTYEKKNEASIVMSSDMLNIVLPIDLLSATLMSNRFYLAIVHRKPMIVNVESVQASFVKKFNLGLIVKNEENIHEKIMEYLDNFDYDSFNKGCNDIIEIIANDIANFENIIKEKLEA